MFRLFAAAALAACTAAPALSDTMNVESPHSVPETIDRFESAAEEAGATIFARIDHAEGAASVDMELEPATLLIFGNPQLGTPAMQDDVRAGLALPLRVLAYEWEGQVYLSWEDPEEMFDDFDIDDDADYVEKMRAALERLAGTATAED
ncbi:DUF302 domain-containing protein [Roseivivax sediminis]|uniref:Uncharacterized conserved protein, DUF302 family n=1 Tax=Roseivivax sediminis TaxID=936889 RepID=A0A1I1SRC3_9RHOB|nr:DUF302 domain-containing protein [Roseivivax sediminis]SFD48966.1 Uncharacterized conserved protein, DUF302 family [Roseivivax sediminis]